jgi:putative transposase
LLWSDQTQRQMQTQYEVLTDTQWQIIEQILKNPRKRKYCLRQMIDGILQVLRTGCQWRNLKHPVVPWESVYYYFRKWKADGILKRLNATLNQKERERQGKAATPSLLCIDNLSVKVAAFVS